MVWPELSCRRIAGVQGTMNETSTSPRAKLIELLRSRPPEMDAKLAALRGCSTLKEAPSRAQTSPPNPPLPELTIGVILAVKRRL